ncbi:MAG: hypothetical protein ABR532_03895, partial [Candidatus Dormibacteria bacterium]
MTPSRNHEASHEDDKGEGQRDVPRAGRASGDFLPLRTAAGLHDNAHEHFTVDPNENAMLIRMGRAPITAT